jgi:hypothetical protein
MDWAWAFVPIGGLALWGFAWWCGYDAGVKATEERWSDAVGRHPFDERIKYLKPDELQKLGYKRFGAKL